MTLSPLQRRCLLLCCACVFAATGVFAQEAPADEEPLPALSPPPLPPDLPSAVETPPTPSPAPQTHRADPPGASAPSASGLQTAKPEGFGFGVRVPRFFVETLSASVLGVGFAVVGGAAGCAVDSSSGMFGCLNGLAIGGAVGGLVGVLAGTVIAGYLMDGNGAVAVTALGEIVGAAAGFLILTTLMNDHGSNVSEGFRALVGVASLLSLPVVGAALGYELSSDVRRSRVKKKVSVRPVLAPTSEGGALVAVAGRF